MKKSDSSFRPAVLFLSHGGGPLPLLGDEGHKELVDAIKNSAHVIAKPSAIVVISAHWEEGQPTITQGAAPALIYDYYGFPKEAYGIQYPALGEPLLAHKVFSLLNDNGFKAVLDAERGFDHGVFVPLKIMFPEADIPCIQLSLVNNLDPQTHIKIGAALGELKQEGLLVLGSGFSFHNLNAFFAPRTPESQFMNESFEKWLINTCSDKGLSEAERTDRLVNWESAPFARYCHPREDHLLPLHVCYGAARHACREVFAFNVLGKKASAYLW